jgi:hypothetical protein
VTEGELEILREGAAELRGREKLLGGRVGRAAQHLEGVRAIPLMSKREVYT